MVCRALAYSRGVHLDFTLPGELTDGSHIESSNGRLRDECLNLHQFLSLDQPTRVIEALRIEYNNTDRTSLWVT
jgi:putative transposase